MNDFKIRIEKGNKMKELILKLDELLDVIQKIKLEVDESLVLKQKDMFPHQWIETSTNVIANNKLNLEKHILKNNKNKIEYFLSMLSYDMQHVDDIDLSWSAFKDDLRVVVNDNYNLINKYRS